MKPAFPFCLTLVRAVCPLAVLFCLVCLVACAPKAWNPVPVPLTAAQNDPASPEQNIWMLRHKIRLEMPARDMVLSFTGIMELHPAQKRLRAIAQTGMGMTLFDISIRGDEGPGDAVTLHSLHPSLARIPHVEKHLALVLGRVWLDCMPLKHSTADGTFQALQDGTEITALLREGALQNAAGRGPREEWSLTARWGKAPLWPAFLHFTNQKGGYALDMNFIDARPVTPAGKTSETLP